jgi:hypothetical protein
MTLHTLVMQQVGVLRVNVIVPYANVNSDNYYMH